MRLKKQVEIFEKISLLLRSGMSIDDCIYEISIEEKRKNDRSAINSWISKLKRGELLSFAIRDTKINRTIVSYIRQGEISGDLQGSICISVKELKSKIETREKIINSLIYPTLIICISLFVVFFLLIYIVPKISLVFSTLNTDLPLTTKFLIKSSSYLKEKLFYIITALVILPILSSYFYSKSLRIKVYISSIIFITPFIKDILIYKNLSEFFDQLSNMMKVGVSLSDSLKNTKDICDSVSFSKIIENIIKQNTNGRSFHESLSSIHTIPRTDVSMIRAGEMSGNFINVLKTLSIENKKRVDSVMKRLVVFIEPTVMIFIGLFISFIAISMIMPIYSITQNLNQISR